MAGAPSVFISYSWDGVAHRKWVRELATRLVSNGVRVWLDEWHVRAGDSLTAFMERKIATSGHVLVVCTPQYARKANTRRGGVGYEQQIISGRIAAGIQRRLWSTQRRKTVRLATSETEGWWLASGVARNQMHPRTFEISLSAHYGVRRVSVTLAWFTPVQPGRRAYKGVRLKVEEPDFKSVCSKALAGQAERKPRGTIYHRVWEGTAARRFVAGQALELRVSRDPDQGDELPDLVQFGLAATVEVEDGDVPVYEEVRAQITVKPRVPVLVGT
jgi:hypothetical protein